jgi:hypothetical protein
MMANSKMAKERAKVNGNFLTEEALKDILKMTFLNGLS